MFSAASRASMSAPPPLVSVDTVASLLRGRDTRAATLAALDADATPIDPAVALAASPALADLLMLDASEVGQSQFDCIGLLLGRLSAEASDDPSPVFGAAFGGDRLATLWSSEGNVLARALQKPAAELTRADAYTYACQNSIFAIASVRGYTKLFAAAGFSAQTWFGWFFGAEFPLSK